MFGKQKIGCIIQARMNSSRLPGKILKPLADKTVLEQVVSRVRLARTLDETIVATTVSALDKEVADLCGPRNIPCFRGSEENVLSRYYEAAKAFNLTGVVRVTADCPLIDPQIIDQLCDVFKTGQYDFVANVHTDLSKRTFPRGLDVEIFSFEVLKEAFENAKEDYQKEHVTPFMYENAKNLYCLRNERDYSSYRLTLDTSQDYELISTIYQRLYKGKHDFFLKEIIDLLEKEPELTKINKSIEQKAIR